MKKTASMFCFTVLFLCVNSFIAGAYTETIEVVKNPTFEDIKMTSSMEQYIMIKKGGYWGYADKAENEVIQYVYNSVNAFSEGVAAVEKDGKYGFINEAGAIVVSIEYDKVYRFSEGLAAVKK